MDTVTIVKRPVGGYWVEGYAGENWRVMYSPATRRRDGNIHRAGNVSGSDFIWLRWDRGDTATVLDLYDTVQAATILGVSPEQVSAKADRLSVGIKTALPRCGDASKKERLFSLSEVQSLR
jgi:hypothetical protein